MASWHRSCTVILTLVGLTIGCGIAFVSVAMATATWKCTTYNGNHCDNNKDACSESRPCYCPPGGYAGFYYREDVCTDEDPEWSNGEESLLVFFLCLFLALLIASIVCCCCRCCYLDQNARVPQYFVVAPGPYPQGGPQYFPPAPEQYPQAGKV